MLWWGTGCAHNSGRGLGCGCMGQIQEEGSKDGTILITLSYTITSNAHLGQWRRNNNECPKFVGSLAFTALLLGCTVIIHAPHRTLDHTCHLVHAIGHFEEMLPKQEHDERTTMSKLIFFLPYNLYEIKQPCRAKPCKTTHMPTTPPQPKCQRTRFCH